MSIIVSIGSCEVRLASRRSRMFQPLRQPDMLCRLQNWKRVPVHRHCVTFATFRFMVITSIICTSVQKSLRRRNRPHRVKSCCRENSFSAVCRVPTFVISHMLTCFATRSPPVAFRHQRQCFSQFAPIRLSIILRTRTPLAIVTLHSVCMQSNHLI